MWRLPYFHSEALVRHLRDHRDSVRCRDNALMLSLFTDVHIGSITDTCLLLPVELDHQFR